MQAYVQRNIKARSRNHCCCGKAINITYSECVFVALVIQPAKRKQRIIMSSVGRLAVLYFFTLSLKRHDFRKKTFLDIESVFWFYLKFFSETFLILRRIQRDIMNIDLQKSSSKHPVFPVRFQWKLEVCGQIFEKYSNIKFHENPFDGSRLFHTEGRMDRQTDMTKVIVTSCIFVNAPLIALPKHILSRSYDRESSCQWRIDFTLEFFTTSWDKKLSVLSREISQNIRHKLSTLKCMSVRSRLRDSTITATILTGIPRFYSVIPQVQV